MQCCCSVRRRELRSVPFAGIPMMPRQVSSSSSSSSSVAIFGSRTSQRRGSVLGSGLAACDQAELPGDSHLRQPAPRAPLRLGSPRLSAGRCGRGRRLRRTPPLVFMGPTAPQTLHSIQGEDGLSAMMYSTWTEEEAFVEQHKNRQWSQGHCDPVPWQTSTPLLGELHSTQREEW